MRVISGSAKGRKLRSVPGNSTRPITDRVKESLFNIISSDIQNSSFLDLFAGTGSVGIEALSRGADSTVFLDINKKAISTVHANLKSTKLAERADVRKVDAFTFLGNAPRNMFDYIYIAPPQYKRIWIEILKVLDNNVDWLSQDGWVITQIHPREFELLELRNLDEFDRRTYGSTMLIFYQRVEVE
jgi:16S rRNA (guanine966-N2)-methyltransferase